MEIALIELILSTIEKGAEALPGIIAAAKQSGVLTDEQAAAFTARMESAFASSAWKTDDELGK